MIKKYIDNILEGENKLIIAAIAVIFVIYTISMANYVSQLKSIPSCIFGCDLYQENGQLINLREDPTNLWKSAPQQFLNMTSVVAYGPFYLRLPFTLFYPLGDSWKGMIPYSFVMLLISLLLAYWFFCKIFDKWVAIPLSLVSLNFALFPLFKYSSSLVIIVSALPLALYYYWRYFFEKNKPMTVVYGTIITILIAFLTNMHVSSFFMCYAFFWMSHLLFLKRILDEKRLKDAAINAAIIFVVSFILIMLTMYMYRILFVYGGSPSYLDQTDILPDLHALYFVYLGKFLAQIFWNTSTVVSTVISILVIAGFVIAALKRRKSYESQYRFMLELTILLVTFSWLVTIPIFNKHIGAFYHLSFYYALLQALFIGELLVFVISNIKMRKNFVNYALLAMAAILVVYNVSEFYAHQDDKFIKQGLQDLSPLYKDVQSHIISAHKDTSKALVITTNELCFGLHGLTGVQCLLYRWPHSQTWDDYQPTWLKGAIILYSNDSEQRKEALESLKAYGFEEVYLYWDANWVMTEYTADSQGKLVNYFDPIRFINDSYRPLLDKNGIKWFEDYRPLDPASVPGYKIRKLTVLSPANYRSATQPWNADLDKYLTEEWSYVQGGQKYAILYKINIP